MENIVNFKDVEKALLEIQGQRVILDSDVARLYGVNTMRVNEAVKNNPDKFPTGYIIELTKDEKNEVIENFDNPKLKFSPVLPKAFTEKGLYMLATILKSPKATHTEKGLYMLATILKSPKATQTTIAIIETFAKIKELTRTVSKISESHDEQEQKGLIQHGGDILSDLLYQEIPISSTETSVELNFAVLKLRHTIKRKK